MVHGITRGPPVDESDLTSFVHSLYALPVEEWRKRIDALKHLVDSIPDYSTTPLDENDVGPMTPSSQPRSRSNNGNRTQITIPWYRSSKSLRRLALPLKNLLLDARSAVVKEATELIATLMMVKLQSHPSLAVVNGEVNAKDEGLETISGGSNMMQQPPPAAFVGRLLFKDLLPSIIDLSKQTVKLIRSYGANMTIDILPHCRVKSCTVVLLERMKTHQNRTVREDCSRYLRCILETWPCSDDIISNEDITVFNSRKEERLSLDSARQIGLGLGRTLSDSAKPVREEAKRGFQVLFRRFRPVWDEVMSSGVVRDIRLRKKLYEAASNSDGKLFDDQASLGEMSLNSAVSGLSYASYRSNTSHRSYAQRGVASNGVPAIIGTPKVSPRIRSRARCSPSGSPRFMQGTGSSTTRVAEQAKIQAKESSEKYATNEYVTSTGHVLLTPPPKGTYPKASNLYGGGDTFTSTQQPFASLLETPNRSMSNHQSPVPMQNSCNILKKRLSRRISGIRDEVFEHDIRSPSNLTSINETEDSNGGNPSATEGTQSTEITTVALEVIAAHLSHIEQIEVFISQEKDLLLDLNKKLGISITDGMKTSELSDRLVALSEEQVCDYFESVHTCVDKQRNAGEDMLKELERISQGDVSGIENTPESLQRQDMAQSPLGNLDLDVQRNLF